MAQDTWASEILEKLGGNDWRQERVEWPEAVLPRWEPLSKRACRYLASRGIEPELARRLGIVEQAERLRVIVPYHGPSGAVIYYTARSYSKLEEGPKYLTASGRHPLYVLPDWRPTDELVLVEGVFDAIAVHQHTGWHVAALGGKSLPRYLQPELLSLVRKRLVVLLDSDALGAALGLQERLRHKVAVTVVPLPPGEDPASLGAGIKELL
jgi:DNA primase